MELVRTRVDSEISASIPFAFTNSRRLFFRWQMAGLTSCNRRHTTLPRGCDKMLVSAHLGCALIRRDD